MKKPYHPKGVLLPHSSFLLPRFSLTLPNQYRTAHAREGLAGSVVP